LSPARAGGEQYPQVAGYQILGELGRGGMGAVYKAWQARLNRLVALKMILNGPHAGSELLARFRAEAEAVARLQHPNIVQIYDVGDQDGRPYFALEYVDGGSLDKKLQGAPVAPRNAAWLVETLARAVHYAHQRGIVHRDLKPANVLLQIANCKLQNENLPNDNLQFAICNLQFAIPKITDFGLAKRLDEDSGQTRSGAVMGTPSYMAPEQAAGKTREIGPAVDIHALGAILYELLTGRPPFRGETWQDTLEQVRSHEPTPPRRLQPRVPRDLQTICLKCLEKEPQKRYASALDLAEDLHCFLNDEPIRARPTRIWERTVKWARRRPARALLMAVGFLVLCGAAAALWYWDAYQRVKVEYYAQMLRRWGAMEGIGRLDEEQVRHRHFSYKFYRRGGRVEKIDIVNGQGFLTARSSQRAYLGERKTTAADGEKACRLEFKRDAQGQVTEEVAFNQAGEIVWIFHFTTPSTGQFTDKRGFPRARTGSGAAYVAFTWSDEGWEKEIRYLDRTGQPQPDVHGVFGRRLDLDERGLPKRITFLGPQGQVMTRKEGYAQSAQVYDAAANLIEEAYLDTAGRPTLHKDGYARATQEFDTYGNRIRLVYRDRQGKPTLARAGYAQTTLGYDDHGNLVEVAYSDEAGRPAVSNEGFARFTRTHDDHGNIGEETYYDRAGKLTLNKTGYARTVLTHDEHGNRIEQSFFDRDGNLTPSRDGHVRVTSRYDARGRVLQRAYYGRDGQLKPTQWGWAKFAHAYDDQGNLREQAYFGVDGKPTLHKHGFHRITRDYDARGNVIGLAYWDCQGKPAWHRDGYARVVWGYDEHGNRNSWAFFDPDGKPLLCRQGYARQTATYDAHGRRLEDRFWDAAGNPTVNTFGYSWRTRAYDSRGHLKEERYFGPDGKPTFYKDGYARYTAVHDERGNRTEVAYWDTNGQLTMTVHGYALAAMTYDSRGNLTEEVFFGRNGKRILLPEGYARFTAAYDDRGHRTEEAYFDLDDQPVLTRSGYARRKWVHDNRGNKVEESYWGTDGKPVQLPDGHARTTWTYDDRGHVTEEAYFGLDGRPARTPSFVARFTARYDDWGNQIEKAYFGPDGEPVPIWDGYARIKRTYDMYGNLVRLAYFDRNGQPTRNRDGYAGIRRVFDARGNNLEESMLGLDGQLTLYKDTPFAKVVRTFDDRSYLVDESFFGADDKPAPLSRTSTIAKISRKLDVRGNILEIWYYDREGRPTQSNYGFARKVQAYDARGNRTEMKFLDLEGKLTLHQSFHYARITWTYDDHYHQVDVAYFDASDKPIQLQVVVKAVGAGGQAERLGIQPGDVVVKYDGKEVANTPRFQAQTNDAGSRGPRKLEVLRGGKPLTFSISPAGLKHVECEDRLPPAPPGKKAPGSDRKGPGP
jgi:YD repeat-containing protein